jgi:phage shock protein C
MAKKKITRRTKKQVKELYRSKNHRMIAGVCGGIGEYLNTDPTLIRLIWALTSFYYGAGILVYLLAWIIIPEKK